MKKTKPVSYYLTKPAIVYLLLIIFYLFKIKNKIDRHLKDINEIKKKLVLNEIN